MPGQPSERFAPSTRVAPSPTTDWPIEKLLFLLLFFLSLVLFMFAGLSLNNFLTFGAAPM